MRIIMIMTLKQLNQRWQSVPATIRKPVVLTVGLLVVIASPFTGVLPGPGGIPVFLIGVAILATEFEWAKRIRDWVLKWVQIGGTAWRKHKVIGTMLIIIVAAGFLSLSVITYNIVQSSLKA